MVRETRREVVVVGYQADKEIIATLGGWVVSY